jgi:hypothetical protein
MYVLISSTTFVWNIFYSKKNWARYLKCYTGLHVNACYSFPILMKLECSEQFFEKYSNIKFHQSPSSGSRIIPCGRTDMMKLIVAFRNFANASKNFLQ